MPLLSTTLIEAFPDFLHQEFWSVSPSPKA